MQVGDVIAWERTFTEEDIRLFTHLSGDAGVHHVTPDAQGRLMVQGLLTATLPTKVGGDLNFLARELVFEFIRPVYAGENIRCQVTLTSWEPDVPAGRLTCQWTCLNPEGKEVLTGHARGVIRTG